MPISVYQSPHNPNRWFFDFDAAAPGGRGGAGVLIFPNLGMASVDGVHRNDLLPKRSTGRLLAEGLRLIGWPQPAILEGYNVEDDTLAELLAGKTGQGTLIGNLLADAARELGGSIRHWQPVPEQSIYHLRIHLAYP